MEDIIKDIEKRYNDNNIHYLVGENKDKIIISCKRVKYNNATYNQAEYICSFKNVDIRAKSLILKTTKSVASKIIDILKDYPNTTFYIAI